MNYQKIYILLGFLSHNKINFVLVNSFPSAKVNLFVLLLSTLFSLFCLNK